MASIGCPQEGFRFSRYLLLGSPQSLVGLIEGDASMNKWSWLIAPMIVVTLAAAPAIAGGKGPGEPSGSSTSSIAIASVDSTRVGAATTSPTPALGDTVTFATTVASLAGWEYPMIAV